MAPAIGDAFSGPARAGPGSRGRGFLGTHNSVSGTLSAQEYQTFFLVGINSLYALKLIQTNFLLAVYQYSQNVLYYLTQEYNHSECNMSL
jgi:hypothetical protein